MNVIRALHYLCAEEILKKWLCEKAGEVTPRVLLLARCNTTAVVRSIYTEQSGNGAVEM